MKKVAAIIQARMGSTRLPGKIFKKLDNDITVLELLIKRIKLSELTDEIIIATTPDEKNKVIIEIAKSYNLSYFVGSEDYVLERFYLAAKEFFVDIIVRITSDCPFVDSKILDDMIYFFKNNEYDYIMNLDTKTNFPEGFDIEIFSFKTLAKIFRLAETNYEKEHVTAYIENHVNDFSVFYYNDKNLKVFKNLRLTLDYMEDLIMLREVYKYLKEKGKGYDFTLQDVLEIIEEKPELMNINKQYI